MYYLNQYNKDKYLKQNRSVMEQNFVRQNGFLKISTIAVTANFMRRNAARMIGAQYIGLLSSRVVCTYVY